MLTIINNHNILVIHMMFSYIFSGVLISGKLWRHFGSVFVDVLNVAWPPAGHAQH